MFRTKVDPARLMTTSQKKRLAALLMSHQDQQIFDAVDKDQQPIVYHVPAPTAKNPQATDDIILAKSLVAYQRKKNPNERRYAVCDSQPLSDESSEANAYFSHASVSVQVRRNGGFAAACKIKEKHKQRFMKRNIKPAAALREAAFLQKISIFHAKPAVIQGECAALIMRRLQGRSLIEYLMEDYEKTVFAEDQRLSLTIMIGEAIVRLHELGIIHRDIKGDNILVELDKYNNPLSVVMIDMGLAKWKGEKLCETGGTCDPIDYRSPEAKRDEHTDEKSDAYSFAVFLKRIVWQVLLQDDPKYKDLSFKHKQALERVMLMGLIDDPRKRASVQEIVDVFKQVLHDRQHTHKLRA